MTTVFDANYARYYDLLYTDKDYPGEANYIESLIKSSSPDAESVLELGSGTGKHAALLVEKGFTLHGVERSEQMLAQAQQLANDKLSFSQGDIRTARVEESFDVALSLFHVISYLPTNDDILAAFSTARNHVKEGGIFIFDVWYGPTVLTDRPAVRVKHMENDTSKVTRTAEPTMYPNENSVQVDYTVFLTDKDSGRTETFVERHHMRYLFTPELEILLGQSGFSLEKSEAWMTGEALGFDTWGACFIARAV